MDTKPIYEISTDKARLDIDLIHSFLASTYWAPGIPRSVVERSIEHSLAFGAFQGKEQVGFARVITDFATFAYIGDVFVIPEHRGRGIARQLMHSILAHPDLQGLRRFLLATVDAHGLYKQVGFVPLLHPDHFLSIHHADVYRER